MNSSRVTLDVAKTVSREDYWTMSIMTLSNPSFCCSFSFTPSHPRNTVLLKNLMSWQQSWEQLFI